MSRAAPSEKPAPHVREPATAPVSEQRPPYLFAAAAGFAVFVLYAITVAPTTAFWDTSEYIATAHILGIPHPPGNPLFVLLARAWELLLAVTGLPTAIRINLFSALMSSLAAGLWFLCIHRVLRFFTADRRVPLIGAATAVLVSATAFTVWNQSNVNEKVYTVSLFTIALLSWLVFLWRDHVEEHTPREARRWHDDNVLVLMAFVLALSVANHLMAFLAAPALLVFILMVKPRVLLNWKLYAWSILFVVIGLSVHLFLPIRSGLDPIINEAQPTCPTIGAAMESILTFGRSGCADLSASLAREQYAKPPVTERLAPFGSQLLNYFQYFDWQWARSVMGRVGYLAAGRLPFTLLFLGLGIFGAMEHRRRDRKSFAYLATLFATLSLGLVFYLNFKYGYGQVQARGMQIDLSEVRERDYFFLVSFSLWGLWAGVGLTALWMRVTEAVAHRARPGMLASPVLAVALLPLVLNWPYASRMGDYAARDWAYNLLQSVEPYAVVFTNGDNDTFPLWYLQEVEGTRQDVTVIVRSYFNTPWYAKQVRDLTRPCPTPDAWAEHPSRIVCQRPFDPQGAPALYRGMAQPPTRTALPLSDEQIDATTAFSSYVQLPESVLFESRGVEATLPAGTFLQPADQLALAIIKEAWGDRPVYFAATTNMHRELGLGESVARQGVAYKLLTPSERGSMLRMPQDQPYSPIFGAYLDVDRTRLLLNQVFVHRDLIDRPHWVDDATRNIPAYYGYARIALAQAEAMLGNPQLAERNARLAEGWLALADR
jgi:hypothetical protein